MMMIIIILTLLIVLFILEANIDVVGQVKTDLVVYSLQGYFQHSCMTVF